ncbi:MAG: hypothetical protein H7061_10195, partial [Bdellovibrionaceae bacterium]|nr:hypothetical protein [Bdellovibrio sp.]
YSSRLQRKIDGLPVDISRCLNLFDYPPGVLQAEYDEAHPKKKSNRKPSGKSAKK